MIDPQDAVIFSKSLQKASLADLRQEIQRVEEEIAAIRSVRHEDVSYHDEDEPLTTREDYLSLLKREEQRRKAGTASEPTDAVPPRRTEEPLEPTRQGHQDDAGPLGVPGGEATARKGDASLLSNNVAVNFKIAQEYLGISERHRQNLVSNGQLETTGKGTNRKITTESLVAYLPPENPN